MSPFVPSHTPYMGYWWLMVLAWDNYLILSACVHKYMASLAKYIASEARCPPFVLSHNPLYGVLVAYSAGQGQLIHIVCLCTQVYGISGQVHGISGKMSPFVPLHTPCMGCWWLKVLAWDKTTKANNTGTSHLQLPCALLLLFVFRSLCFGCSKHLELHWAIFYSLTAKHPQFSCTHKSVLRQQKLTHHLACAPGKTNLQWRHRISY